LDRQAISATATKLANKLGADVIVCNTPITGPYDKQLVKLCNEMAARENCALFLCTLGGDADAAFRIARCLQRRYKKFVVYVCGMCKSAGTIIALGAHEIVMTDGGELGPLDVQLGTKDELWETDSGLTVLSAITTLERKAYDLFEDAFVRLKSRSGGRITLKTATALASQLSVGVISPIMDQIDPMHVGSVSRAMKIGLEYGQRLAEKSRNVRVGTLDSLTEKYPSHEFVIDREEAATLFFNVRDLQHEEERAFIAELEEAVSEPNDNALIGYLSNSPEVIDHEIDNAGDAGIASTETGRSGGATSEAAESSQRMPAA
jgi:hypothetical protein